MSLKFADDDFYSNINPITATKVARCITVMKKSAVVHADRDFPNGFDPAKLARKINSLSSDGKNWIKLRIGRDDKYPDNNEVVIIYHLLKHRIAAGAALGDPNYGFWSISVGIHPRLLAEPTGADPNGTGSAKHPYAELALLIIEKIHYDLGKFTTPTGQVAVIYDDIDPDEPDPSNAEGANERKRRSTKIGEFGWFCQKHNGVATYFTIEPPKRVPHPLDGHGNPIPGWGRTLSEDIVVTKLRRV